MKGVTKEMSSYSQVQNDKLHSKKQWVNRIMLLPIALLLGIVPLIVRMVYVQPKDGRMNIIFGKVQLEDYYSQYKSVAIIVLLVLMTIIFYLFVEKSELKKDWYSKFYLICGGVLLGMTILSTCLSDYKEIALWGMFDRAEGMVMWCCYIFMMFYTYYAIKDERNYKWIIAPLMFLVIVTAILGAFQYAGYDLLVKTKLGQALIIPEEIRATIGSITSDYESHKVLGTLYHYDYVGSFGAMMVPLFSILTIMVRSKKKKIILGIVTLASLFVLLGSTSRAGLVGVILAIVVAMIIFGRKIISNWKKSLPIGIILVVVLIAFNFITAGSIFSRIPTLVEDAMALFKTSDTEFDYRDHIPVREVINENGSVTFVLQGSELTIEYTEGKLKFLDDANQEIAYTVENYSQFAQDGTERLEEHYIISDSRYSNIQIIRQDINVFTKQDSIDAILVTINNLPAMQETQEVAGLIPGSERSPGEGNGNLLQYFCLGNPMDSRAWRATVYGVVKESDRLSN